MFRLPALAPLLLALGLSLGPASAEITVEVDASQRFQTIRGWEVSDRVWEIDKEGNRFDSSWLPYTDLIADALVNEVGINNLRLHLASGTENPHDSWRDFIDGRLTYRGHHATLYETVNDNDDPLVADPAGFVFTGLDLHVEHVMLPMQRALAARGERLYITLCFVDFTAKVGKPRLALAKNPAEYGELVLAAFRHLDTTWGFVPDALEMILEPENTDHWDGRAIGQAIIAVTDRLAAAGYHPKIIAPSTTWAERTLPYMEDILTVPGAGARIDMIAYHRYGLFSRAALPGIASIARQLGTQTGMLEFIYGDIDMLIEDLTVANASAWQQWGIARKVTEARPPNASSSYLDGIFRNGTFEGIGVPLNSRKLAVAFHAFREGAVRIAARSDDGTIDAVAALRPEGGIATILRLHDRSDATVTGLPDGPYTLRGVSDRGKTLAPQTVEVRDSRATLPTLAEGVYSLLPASGG